MSQQQPTAKPQSLSQQFGGSHYKSMGIEPVQYIEANGINFTLGSAIKYITRHSVKNGAVDLKKAIHFVVMDLERVYGVKTRVEFSDDDDVINAEFTVVEDEQVNSDERDNLCFDTAEEMVKKGFPKAICILDRDNGFYIDADMTTNAECVVSPYCKSEREAWNTALEKLLGVASAGAEFPPQAGTEGKTAEQLVKEVYS